jgi:hypothetical protein
MLQQIWSKNNHFRIFFFTDDVTGGRCNSSLNSVDDLSRAAPSRHLVHVGLKSGKHLRLLPTKAKPTSKIYESYQMCHTCLFPQVLHKIVYLLFLFLRYRVLFIRGNNYFGP